MPSYISKVFKYLFGKQERKIIFLGLDASGKTTILYKLALGEVATVIPTIGFVVETVQYKTLKFTAWDVGGCEKIRPLWMQYYRGMDAIVFTVDSNDRDRISEARQELHYMVKESWEHTGTKYAPVLIFATKQDLPGAMDVAEVESHLSLAGLPNAHRVVRCNALTGEGLYEGLDWLSATLSAAEKAGTDPPADSPRVVNPSDSDARRQRAAERLQLWLIEQDEPDDEFLAAVENFTLERWDHKAHLRLAWLLLTRLGRQQAKARLFHLLEQFIQNSAVTKRASGTTFHETMTYFWMHMVHWSLATLEHPGGRGDFRSFLRQSPHLADSGLFLDYYSRKLMLETPETRRVVALPDLRPLPSLVTNVTAIPPQRLDTAATASRKLPLSDDNFLLACESGMVSSWNHECMLRLAFVQLRAHGHAGAQHALADALRRLQGEHYNHTVAMYWLQAVARALVLEFGPELFGDELRAGGRTDAGCSGPSTPERAHSSPGQAAKKKLAKQGSDVSQQAARQLNGLGDGMESPRGAEVQLATSFRPAEASEPIPAISPFAGLSIWALAAGPPNLTLSLSRHGSSSPPAAAEGAGTSGGTSHGPPQLLSAVTWYTVLTSSRTGGAELRRLSHRPMEFLSHFSESRVYSTAAKWEVATADLQALPTCPGLPPLTYLRVKVDMLPTVDSNCTDGCPVDVATSVLSMMYSGEDHAASGGPGTPTAAALHSTAGTAALSAGSILVGGV